MDLGKMKYIIEVYKTTVTQDSGGLVSTPTLYFSCWANVKSMDPSRALAYGVIENYKAYEIKVRYDERITNNLTIKHKGISLTIHGVVNVDELDRMMKIIAYQND